MRSKDKGRVKGRLTKAHAIFNGREINASTVVISTLATMRERHGPQALSSDRLASGDWSAEEVEAVRLSQTETGFMI